LPTLRDQIRDELTVGYKMAAGFCAIAALPLIGIGVLALSPSATARGWQLSFTDWVITVITVFASYFVAATLASPVYTLCRSIRGSVIGSMITGALLTPIIYTTVGGTAGIVWNPVGRLFFGDHGTTQAEFLHEIPELMLVFTCIGLIAGLVMRTKWT
jgi:hypothetical protein